MNIKCENKIVSYGSFKALDNFTFEFEEGNIYCILGQNGCGKTTLLKALVHDNWESRDLAYVAQETVGVIGLTVFEYISLGKYQPNKFYSPLTSEDEVDIENAMKTLEINDLRDRIFDTLSGGEKQRVLVARSLVQNTSWILLDEPGSNMDIRHNALIMDVFKKIKAQGKSFIIVLHDINTAALFADKCVFMKDGRLIASGTPKETMRQELLKEVYDVSFKEISVDGKTLFIPQIDT